MAYRATVTSIVWRPSPMGVRPRSTSGLWGSTAAPNGPALTDSERGVCESVGTRAWRNCLSSVQQAQGRSCGVRPFGSRAGNAIRVRSVVLPLPLCRGRIRRSESWFAAAHVTRCVSTHHVLIFLLHVKENLHCDQNTHD